MKPYVKHVKSPFKGGVDVDLGWRTLIVGPSWSGKSAITASVEYALSGAVSDVVGRQTVKDVNQLLTLGDGESIFAEAVVMRAENLAESVRCETKGKKSTTAQYPAAFPLREVRDALSGNVETVRKFFLRMAAGSVTRGDVEERIPGPYRGLFAQALASSLAGTPAVDLLLHVLDKSKTRARELESEAEASASVVTETTQGIEPVKTADLAAARELLILARAEVEHAALALENARRVAACDAAVTAAIARVADVQQKLAQIAPPADADRVRGELVELLRYAQSKKLGACPCCKQQEVDDVTDGADGPRVDAKPFTADFWAERLALVEAKHASRQSELTQYNTLATHLLIFQQEQAGAEATLSAFTREDDGGEPPGAVDVLEAELSAARARAADFEQRVIALERTAATWEQARRSRDIAAERKDQAAKWAALADACKTAVGELMDLSTKAFVSKVQKHLPAEKHFALQLRDGDREVCRYGFTSREGWNPTERSWLPDAHVDIALSGGEWALLSAALAAAYVEGSPEGALHVIIPEDRSWDRNALTEVLTALSSAPAQVIVATTTEPSCIPAGWTLIRTGSQVDKLVAEGHRPSVAEFLAEPEAPSAAELGEAITAAESAPAPERDLRPSGDFIGPVACPHGVVNDYCQQCMFDRKEREGAPKEAPPSLSAPTKRRGRPKGSKNKPAATSEAPVAAGPAELADGPVELE